MTSLRAIMSDASLALRRLRQSPGFTLVCVLTVALGIGGNTAVFTLVDGVLLKPLPVARPSELHRLGDTDACCVNTGLAGSFSLFSYDLYLHLRDAAPEFDQLAAFQANTASLTLGYADPAVPAETLTAAFVSGNYFQMFELAPAAGRLIQPADDRAGSAAVAVISHGAWIERFAGRPDIIGRPVTLNGVPAVIVGVAPQGFYGETLRPGPPKVWVPLSNEPAMHPASRLLEAKGSHWLYAIGRLRPGVATAPIGARLTAALQAWLGATLELSADERRQVPLQHVTVTSASGGVRSLRDAVRPSLALLQAIAGAVLLIACANLANLLIARGMGRRTEIAVRVALGAPRRRLATQLLVESLMLACAGGAAGLAVSFVAARTILSLAFPGGSTLPLDVSPSLMVVGFALGASLVTGVAFGVAPAIVGSRGDPLDAMRASGRSTTGRQPRLRRALVAAQVALSLVLVTCAGLLGRTLTELQSQDFGFTLANRHVAYLALSLGNMPPEQLSGLYVRMRESVRGIRGIENAAFSLYAPMSGDNWASRIAVDGHDSGERLDASWNRASPGYFETLGIRVVRGRTFDDRDRAGAPLVAVVSERFARTFFGDGSPIGRRVGFLGRGGRGAPDIEIIGLVADTKYQDGRTDVRPMFYLPFLQTSAAGVQGTSVPLDRSHYPQALEILAPAAGPALESEVRAALAGVDRRIAVRAILPMEEQVRGAFSFDRLLARLTAAFAFTALLLACLGIYGVTSYAVVARTREIGVRMAVGASRGRVLATVFRGAMVQLWIGIGVGLPCAFIAGRLLQARLFGISGHDARVVGAGTLLLLVFTAIAALLPACRAALMDPTKALRLE